MIIDDIAIVMWVKQCHNPYYWYFGVPPDPCISLSDSQIIQYYPININVGKQ